MKKGKVSDPAPRGADELSPEYRFDYGAARPNRFAGRVDLEQKFIALDADVSRVFQTSESVNAVLRALISTMPPPVHDR
jgi:hypothetical protein